MPPTQQHRWFSRPDSRARRRNSALLRFAVDQARDRFEASYPGACFGPVVALVAAYNEEENLGDVLKSMPEAVEGLEVSTLVVVDGATDGTAGVARQAGVYTCVLPVNLGQGAALRLGYELAAAHGARYVVTLDADGQNDPAETDSVLGPLLEDTADFVIASRRLGVDQTTDRFRQAGVTLYASVLNRMIGQPLSDSSNGFRAFKVELLGDILPLLVEDQYQTAEVVITAASRGWRITERPAVWRPRASGTSKKGGNLFFGFQYARVIASTWLRVTLRNQRR